MTRVPSYDRSIGSCERSELFFSPEWDIPLEWSARGRWKTGPLHTFTDDYRQEFFWRHPQQGLMVALSAGICTAPDYTIWTSDPFEWCLYQSWRSATIAAYWQRNGVRVIPVVSFDGGVHVYAKRGSVWAVRGSADGAFCSRLEAFIDAAGVSKLVVFGVPLFTSDVGCEVVRVPLHSRKGRAAQKEGREHGR